MTFPNVKNDAGASTKAQKSQCFFEGVAGLWPATLSPKEKNSFTVTTDHGETGNGFWRTIRPRQCAQWGPRPPWVVQRLLRFNSSATMEGRHTTHRRVKSVVSRPLLDERVVEGRTRVEVLVACKDFVFSVVNCLFFFMKSIVQGFFFLAFVFVCVC